MFTETKANGLVPTPSRVIHSREKWEQELNFFKEENSDIVIKTEEM